jgi:catechol 2,3-dioxygenase-like lactoylglutathione lyase family enzyme
VGVTLDHVGVAAHDLDALAATYQGLGFTLTPLARHAGRLRPDGPVVPFGTGNRCAMLGTPAKPQGYLELIARIDPNAPANSLDRFLQRYEGIHIVAFGIDDAEAELARLRREGFDLPGVAYLERPVDQTDAAKGIAKFARLPLPNEASPEGRMQLMRHLTPELIWRDAWLEHANRAVQLAGLAICVADVAEAAGRFARLTGVAAWPSVGMAHFELADARLTLAAPAALEALLPGVAPPTLPFIAGVTIATADEGAAIRAIAGGTGRNVGHGFLVPPGAAGGTALLFR